MQFVANKISTAAAAFYPLKTLDDLHASMIRNREELIIKILEEYLQGPPTVADAKRTKLYQQPGIYDKHCLSYDGILLGTIVIEIHPSYKLNFTPDKNNYELHQLG